MGERRRIRAEARTTNLRRLPASPLYNERQDARRRAGISPAQEAPVTAEQAKAKELNSALIRAILADDVAGVGKSLEAGAIANPPDGMPIITAAAHVNVEIARLLLAHGATPDPLNHCCAPLYRAVITGRTPMVKLLLDAGARQGLNSSLWAAARQEKSDVLLLLINVGANVNTIGPAGQTALHIAARIGRAESVKILLQAGCDQYCRDRKDQLPVDYTRANNHADVVKILLANAAT